MDNNKKIIIGVVGVIVLGTLVLMMKFFFFDDTTSENTTPNTLHFETPTLEGISLDNPSKKELYDNENLKNYTGRYDSIVEDLSFGQGDGENSILDKYNNGNQNTTTETDNDLQVLMEFQKALNDPAMQGQATGYGNQRDPYYHQQEQVVVQKQEEVKKPEIPQKGSYFFGSSSAKNNATVGTELIPAETIDQGLYQSGSTIAIRSKKALHIPEKNVTIPKGAVMYGVINFTARRMTVNVTRYKKDNKLYNVALNVYDFDGLEGIHVKHRSIFGIPSQVSKDVYNAAVQTYQQQGGFGNSQEREPLDKIAALSALKEVSKEVFDKRRVFLPRKYHLWLTIKLQDNEN